MPSLHNVYFCNINVFRTIKFQDIYFSPCWHQVLWEETDLCKKPILFFCLNIYFLQCVMSNYSVNLILCKRVIAPPIICRLSYNIQPFSKFVYTVLFKKYEQILFILWYIFYLKVVHNNTKWFSYKKIKNKKCIALLWVIFILLI